MTTISKKAGEVLPNWYYYNFFAFDVVIPTMAHLPVLSDSHHFMYQLIPTGYDQYTDKMMKDGVYSYRVGQMALMPLVIGAVWSISAFFLLRLARYGMTDRPDLVEKLMWAYAISGAIVDPIYLVLYLTFLPRSLLLSPPDWTPVMMFSMVWLVYITFVKGGYCAGWFRATGAEAMQRSATKAG